MIKGNPNIVKVKVKVHQKYINQYKNIKVKKYKKYIIDKWIKLD